MNTFFAHVLLLLSLCIGENALHGAQPQHLCPDQIVRRMALDIGSGRVKMQVSDVNITSEKITNVLLTDTIRVALREDLVKNADTCFSAEIESQLIAAIKELLRKSAHFHPQSYHAIATESFRIAKNGCALVERIKKETGLSITIISQEEEGILGFLSATHEVTTDPERVVSWDFGAGSFQITTKSDDQFYIYQGKLGKIPFKNSLLDIQGKESNPTGTPNPISKEDLDQALTFIEESIDDVPAEILEKLHRADVVVLGIGIHPLWGMKDNKSYDQARLMQEIENRLALDNDAIVIKDSIDQNYKESASFVVSNLILAYGLMKSLGIDKVEYVGTESANAIGTLLSSKYWKECPF